MPERVRRCASHILQRISRVLTRSYARDMLDEYGVRLNVIGKTSLLPPAVQAAVAQAESMSRHNSKYVSSCVQCSFDAALTRAPEPS